MGADTGPDPQRGPFDDDAYVLLRFPAAQPGEAGWPAMRAWALAGQAGFYDRRHDDEYLAKCAALFAADGRELTGLYEAAPSGPWGLGADVPVATFATLRKTLNAGHGRLVPAHLVTWVTVRTSHRRRGLLRRMMSADLARAKADGVPVAALTASEGAIYRRFGFGVATAERAVTVDAGPRFRLAVAAGGRVEMVEPAVLAELGPQLFDRVHRRTPGSVGRHERYRLAAAGQFARSDGGEDRELRAALHLGDDGRPDGYVTYAFLGWEAERPTVEVRDLVAATHSAYLGLWEFLGSLDLIERIVWKEAPADDPLPWALADPRVMSTTEARDMLWLRILDTEAALGARGWGSDGGLTLRVEDQLGLASGTFRLTVSGGTGAAERIESAPGGVPGAGADLVLDVADLSSLYCGGVGPATLAAAGRITEHRPGALREAEAMFALERPAHCLTHF
ncbi:GNAT family N-acetyltransferase [Sinomonas halotolerans]|uniref:GNAT family N-acetyltransferase n=1 Tax=Sinomonas halotolerans TaxID=1644133 RepID=A0ABU9X192_9MICC